MASWVISSLRERWEADNRLVQTLQGRPKHTVGYPRKDNFPSSSQKSSGRDERPQSLVQAIRNTPRSTRTHHTPPVASRETNPKSSDSSIPSRLIKVLGLPVPFPTSA
jgi:SRSO17 transposase